MPKQVRWRRGTTAEHATFTGAEGEVTVDITKKTLVVHDGVTPGGWPVNNTPGGSASAQALAISLAGTDTIAPAAGVLSHFVDATVSAGSYTRKVVLSLLGAADGKRIAFHFALPAAVGPVIELRNGLDTGTVLLSFTPRADAAVPRSVDCEYRGGAWRLVDTNEITDHVRLSGDTMTGPLHFPQQTLAFASLQGVSMEGAKFQHLTATGDVTFFTVARAVASGPAKRVFVIVNASNVAGISLAFADGIKVLGDDLASIPDGQSCLFEFQSHGPSESDTIVVAHGQVAIGAGGGGGGDPDADPDPDPPQAPSYQWLFNVNTTADNWGITGPLIVGNAGDSWSSQVQYFGNPGWNLPRAFADGSPSGIDCSWAIAPLQSLNGEAVAGQTMHEHEAMQAGLVAEWVEGGYCIENRQGFALLLGQPQGLSKVPAGSYVLYVAGSGANTGQLPVFAPLQLGLFTGETSDDLVALNYSGSAQCTYDPDLVTAQLLEGVQWAKLEFTLPTDSNLWIAVRSGQVCAFQLAKLA